MTEIINPKFDKLQGPPVIKKSGIFTMCGSEASIFVWCGRLMVLSNKWAKGNPGYPVPGAHAIISDYNTGESYPPVGHDGCCFYQAYCENDFVYVYGSDGRRIWCMKSDDLIHWEEFIAVELPENFECFNTAVCKGHLGYVMAIECGGADDRFPDRNDHPNPYIGTRFTEFFAVSDDLRSWTMMPPDKAYTKERYNACPALKYCDGYYYMICLESLPCWRWAPYIYRTSDFDTWEVGYYNPLFVPSREDYFPKAGVVLTPEEQAEVFSHICTNNSDIDLCEFDNKTYIVYCTGNQGLSGGGSYCEAIYDGSLDDFLKANFS